MEYDVLECGWNTILSSSGDGLSQRVECVGIVESDIRNHLSLYNSIFMDRLSGLTIGTCVLLK